MKVAPTFLILLIVTSTATAQVDESPDAMIYGHLRGRFVYDGRPPAKAKPVRIELGDPFLRGKEIVDESLVVHERNGGVANVIVALQSPQEGDAPLKVHKSYEKLAKKTVELEFRGARIIPHVLSLRSGQKLQISNRDPLAHNAHVQTRKNRRVNVIVPPGDDYDVSLTQAEPPFPLVSSLYPWMRSYILVHDNPYFALTGADGSFEIRNIPSGERTFQFWHEKAGKRDKGIVASERIRWKNGRMMIMIKPGTNDVGEIRLPPVLFTR